MPVFQSKRLIIATHNAGKAAEFAALFRPFNVETVSAADLNLLVPDETEDTFVGNARLKARAASAATGLPALADDSGITVDGLDGAPGVYTADWAETPDGRNFDLAMARTWEMLELRNAPFPRRAQFRCALVMARPTGSEVVCEGMVSGQVVWPKRGRLGHGFDPIFLPDGQSLTFGEMDQPAKNQISHRARAFDVLIRKCFT